MNPKDIVVGATYSNRGAGTTRRTVVRIEYGIKPTESVRNPRGNEAVVVYEQHGKHEEQSLYLASFAKWSGHRVYLLTEERHWQGDKKPALDIVIEAWNKRCEDQGSKEKSLEGAGTFDGERAFDIGNLLRQHFADGIGDFATARRRVCDDMQRDAGLWIAYQSNIAMTIIDNSVLNHTSCNRIADQIMRVLFEAPRQPGGEKLP